MKKLTQEDFIKRCHDIWGDIYDLSSVEYISTRVKINVTCRKHGVFSVSTNNFTWNKSGCPTCGGQFGKPSDQFTIEAQSVHGDRYDYSKSNYTRYDRDLTIICREHGEFRQKPYVHIRGAGCPPCGKVKRITTDDFIRRSKEIYGNKYGYDKTRYTNATTEVTIQCPEHGHFNQLAYNHLRGGGCKKCGYKKISSSKQWKQSYAKSLCDKSGIEIVKYSGNASSNSTLRCKLGHEWSAPISRIKRGSSCPSCAKSGYNPSKAGYVYFLVSDDYLHMKIGLSNAPSKRIKLLINKTPFKFKTAGWIKKSGLLAPKLETALHKQCKTANLTGFDGCTEWFEYDESVILRTINGVN